MRGLTASKAIKYAAGIMAGMMLVVFLFSAFYIAAEADHDCSGGDCPICTCIRQCENLLHPSDDGTTAQPAVVVPVVFFLLSAVLPGVVFPQETLVSRKVRLDN